MLHSSQFCKVNRHKILLNRWGCFRGVEIDPAGLHSDQGMLNKSAWNSRPGILTDEGEWVGADEGYSDAVYINIVSPFKKEELDEEPELKPWNKVFNRDRGLIERTFAILKGRFAIFDMPWKRDIDLFPVALRVCLKLLNRYWRLNENVPPGLQRKIDQIEWGS